MVELNVYNHPITPLSYITPPQRGVFYLWYNIFIVMKYIITEGQHKKVMTKMLKILNIEYDLVYRNDNRVDKIWGTVYLYKDDIPFWYQNGFEFYYDYDMRDRSLTYSSHRPSIETIGYFDALPPEFVVNFFSDELKSYLEDYISKGRSKFPI